MAAKPPPDTKDLDATLAALNRSAERLQTLWFTFLGLTLYFAISTLTVTHLQLLLETPQKLPVLNIDVPLLPFFAIAPTFYLIIHVYMLMMLVLLARSASGFEAMLPKAVPAAAKQEQYRLRAENALFLQLLVGAESERRGRNGLLLSAVALVTLALAPVLVLLLFQLMFLPYHHFALTWWHRALVAVDVLAILFLWSAYRRGDGVVRTPAERNPLRWSPSAMAHGFAALLALHVSVNIGRWAGEPPLRDCFRTPENPEDNVPGHACLIADGPMDYSRTENGILFGDRLQLANQTIVGQKLFEEKQTEGKAGGGDRFVPTRDFSGRNFTAANFRESDLRGVLLDRAVGWQLLAARIQLQSARSESIQLQRSILASATLQGAWLPGARLQGASLDGAELQGARLHQASMQGARLAGAQLQGAWLMRVQLQGAQLAGAQLQGALLHVAQLQGALLKRAELQGANLTNVKLQGALLDEAQLQGAMLVYASLQGASLVRTQLQGSWLDQANLRATDLRGAIVFRMTDWKLPSTENSLLHADARGVVFSKLFDNTATRDISVADVEGWRAAAVAYQAAGHLKEQTALLFNRLLPVAETDEDHRRAEEWRRREVASVDTVTFDRLANEEWIKVGCESTSAPYVARGLVNLWFLPGIDGEPGPFPVSFVRSKAFLDKLHEGRSNLAACPGVKGFTEADWERVDELLAVAARQAAAPTAE